MNEEVRVNRPVGTTIRSDMPSDMGGRRSGSKLPWVVLVVVVLVIIVVAILFRDKWGGSKAGKSSDYQAVFLTNGQVYFGKLSDAGKYLKLSDIFYLQVNQPQIQGSQQTEQQAQQAQAQPQLQLVKLGSELHGPKDEMSINRDQVLFFEDMKDDGKVMEAIKQYKANPNAANSGAQTPPPATGTQPTPAPAAAPTPTPTPAPAQKAPTNTQQ